MKKRIAGIDEVGRGCLAGPVFAAAVSFRPGASCREIVRDSKALSRKRRKELARLICSDCDIGYGQASVEEIDALNIRRATHLAMRRAVLALGNPADFSFIVDGHEIPEDLAYLDIECRIKADATVPEVSAASIAAKVARDELMASLSLRHAGYGWERNAGYGTREHRDAIMSLGMTPLHRRSFSMGV